MKVLNPNPGGATSVSPENVATDPAQSPDDPRSKRSETENRLEAELSQAVADAREAVEAQGYEYDKGAEEGAKTDGINVGEKVDVEAATGRDALLSAANDGAQQSFASNLEDVSAEAAVVEQRHKDAFIESVITGERYREDFDLFNGRVHLVVRARSVAETDALTAYARRMISVGEIKVNYEYSALMRRLLAVAQVEELNGVRNPPLESPLFFEETESGVNPPAWEGRLKVWGDKPEAVLIAVVKCILEFEARYWHMINHVDDENFWKPEESTGE